MKHLLLIISIFISTLAFSINPNDTITKANLDFGYLEQLALDKINKYRSDNNLSTLLIFLLSDRPMAIFFIIIGTFIKT